MEHSRRSVVAVAAAAAAGAVVCGPGSLKAGFYLGLYVVDIKAPEFGLFAFFGFIQAMFALLAGELVDPGDCFRSNHCYHLIACCKNTSR